MNKLNHQWKILPLADLCDKKTGLQTGPFGSQLHAAEYSASGVPVVMPKDIMNGRVSDESIARIPQGLAQTMQRHRLIDGDIVFGRRGDIGRCALITENERGWLCGTGCLRARLDHQKADPHYVIQFLDWDESQAWLQANAVGQTMLNLNTAILAKLPILLPPLPEQRAIAAILSTWDEAITLTKRLIAALRQRKQALMQMLLTGEVRFPGFEEEESSLVPLQDVVYFQEGPGLRKWQYTDNGIPFLNIRCIQNGQLDLKNVQYLDSMEVKTKYSHFLLEAGDFVVSSSGTLGRVAIIKPDHLPIMLNTSIIRFRSYNEDVLRSRFLFHYLQSKTFYEQILTESQGSAQANFGPSHLKKLDIELPSLPQQKAIAQFLDSCTAEIQTLSSIKEHMSLQKRGLMQQLLTGAIRVQVEE